MSNKRGPVVRKRSEPDPRTERSTRALGRALVALIQERGFDHITVQDILDRAGVARSTFYAHYRSKEDALHSGYERLFLALEAMLERQPSGPRRLFPVRELLEHVADTRGMVEALQASGRLDEVWELCAAYAARIIERRLPRSTGQAIPPRLLAHMLAGALVEMIRWWYGHPGVMTARRMDEAFHGMAWSVRVSERRLSP